MACLPGSTVPQARRVPESIGLEIPDSGFANPRISMDETHPESRIQNPESGVPHHPTAGAPMPGPSPPVATVTDVTHRYGRARALDAVSVEIPSGCMVGLIGPDGVGKSTLMGLIAGAKKIQSGHVHALGGD